VPTIGTGTTIGTIQSEGRPDDPVEAIGERRNNPNATPATGRPAAFHGSKRSVKSGKAKQLTDQNLARFVAQKTGQNAKCLI
jgi:hypothetical protein